MTDTEKPNGQDVEDGNAIATVSYFIKKTLDVNKYATKKTIAQGLLDVALLTANASQLKYVLQVGEKHEFYTLMLSLIIISIVLQVTAAMLSIFLGFLRVREDEQSNTVTAILNQVSLAFVTGAMFSDIIKMNFGLDPAIHVVQACLCVFLGSSIDINKEDDHPPANKANNIVLCLNLIIMAVNILINSFEMKDGSGDKTSP